MRFFINNSPVEVGPVPPDMTLLRYLRTEQHLTGTKEGCASGDCGACTVLMAKAEESGWHYESLNSCICPLGSMHDQQIYTVEGLAGEAGMHPVQEAMVNCHGSQCGFCTPGFVMSLAGLQESQPQGEPEVLRHRVLDAISGNLCRCTGYRPIVEAGMQALKKPAHVINNVQKGVGGAPLAGSEVLSRAGSYFWQPTTEADLQALLKEHPDARLVAGGTDLMLESTQLYRPLPKLIDLNRVESLKQVRCTPECVSLGAAATYTDLERELSGISRELVDMLARLGSRQIRNRGTVGGNIANASPIADMPPYLLVLDAELIIRNARGESRTQLLTDFYLDYKKTRLHSGEYLAEVQVARQALTYPLRLYKISKRYEDDISAVMGAFLWSGPGKLAIAYGGMAATPKRARATEALLSQTAWFDGEALNEEILERACEVLRSEFAPMSDVRASAEYRMEMACNLLRKALEEMVAEHLGRPIEEEVFSHA